MIKFLRNWCEGIVISVFITIIIEMFLPSGNIKKYIRVIIGVYIVFVILNPIILNINTIDIENILNLEPTYSENLNVTEVEIINIYEKAIEKEIKEKFKNIENVSITMNSENIEKIEIVIAKDFSNVEEIKKFLIETYQVKEVNISVIT